MVAREFSQDIIPHIVTELEKSKGSEALGVFLHCFTSNPCGLKVLSDLGCIERLLEKLWLDFRYTFEPDGRSGKLLQHQYAYTPYLPTAKVEEGLEWLEIAQLLALTASVDKSLLRQSLIGMKVALAHVSEQYLFQRVIPLIKALLAREIPCFILEEDLELSETISEYIRTVLCSFIRRTVPAEPVEPRDWSLPDHGCKICDACKHVAEFMADPKRTKLEYQVHGEVRKHLDGYFGGLYGRSDHQYDVHTEKHKIPHIWICVKKHKTYKKDLSLWRTRTRKAKKTLDNIGGKKHAALKAYLGEHYAAIALCQPGQLPDLGPADEVSVLGENTNQSSTLSSAKRKAHEMDDKENTTPSASKRPREDADELERPIEIIDLT